MAGPRRWVTVTTASALGIGVLASGALGIARAMPLVDSTTVAPVPPITTLPTDSLEGPSPSGGPVTPAPTPLPTSSGEPSSSPDIDRAPAPTPQPVSPRPSTSASPASPVTVEDDSDSGGDDSGGDETDTD